MLLHNFFEVRHIFSILFSLVRQDAVFLLSSPDLLLQLDNLTIPRLVLLLDLRALLLEGTVILLLRSRRFVLSLDCAS